MPRLTVVEGIDEGRQFDLTEPVVAIGRDSSSAIRLLDTEVSRRHAEFRTKPDGGYSVHDAGSANGVYLNGRLIASADLRAGDRVRIGKTTVLYGGVMGEAASDSLPMPVRVVTRTGGDLPSSIVRSIDAIEGSQILTKSDEVRSPWLRTRLANLSIMYEAIQAVSHILDIDQLLERILELLFRSVDADRGCVLLRNSPDDPLEARAVRWREGSGQRDEISLSRTIIDHVLREQKGVIVTDAGQDERFRTGASVVRFGIREAICVPLMGRRETVGILYFDTFRSTTGGENGPARLNEDHLSLAAAVAHQTAVAVEETRYYLAMIQSERLAAVGQAIASLSHHIKNILQGMRSGADVLKIGLDDKNDASIQAGWRLIEKNQSRIYDLVLDMLTYSKERDPVCELHSVESIVQDVIDLTRGRATELGVTLRFESAELPPCHLDADAIHRAVLNLVGNAIDAVEGCDHPQILVRTSQDVDSILISVHDNGCGIEPERMTNLFRPFQSTKGSRGTGLGLAVSQKIAREHGGDLLVTSRVGQGSEFTMRLPTRLK